MGTSKKGNGMKGKITPDNASFVCLYAFFYSCCQEGGAVFYVRITLKPCVKRPLPCLYGKPFERLSHPFL